MPGLGIEPTRNAGHVVPTIHLEGPRPVIATLERLARFVELIVATLAEEAR
jgi:hypothetical protein